MDAEHWIIGLIVSLVLGYWVTDSVLDYLREGRRLESDQPKGPKPEEAKVPLIGGGKVGLIERTFFTLVVAFDMGGVITAMMAWVAAKMVVNWKRGIQYEETMSKKEHWMLERSALLGSMVSMIFALVGGLICRGQFW